MKDINPIEVYVLDYGPHISANDLSLDETFHVTRFVDEFTLLHAVESVSPACVVLNLRSASQSSNEFLGRFAVAKHCAPIVVVSVSNCIRSAVDAIQLGAFDYISQPITRGDLIARVQNAICQYIPRSERNRIAVPNIPGMEPLTLRERQVLEHSVLGASAKEVANILNLSRRTVEQHRGSILRKFNARNIVDLCRVVFSNSD